MIDFRKSSNVTACSIHLPLLVFERKQKIQLFTLTTSEHSLLDAFVEATGTAVAPRVQRNSALIVKLAGEHFFTLNCPSEETLAALTRLYSIVVPANGNYC